MAKKKRRSKGKPKRAVKAVRRRSSSSRSRSTKKGRRVRPAHPAKSVKKKKVVDPEVAKALKQYADAMRYFNRQSFRRAHDLFARLVTGPSRELAERARVHLAMCEQRLRRAEPVRLRSAEEHYNYAVSQLNLRNYEEAREHLQKARKLSPKSDHIHYGLASLAALCDEPEEALEHLEKAIELRPENRYHARNDLDFEYLRDDPRFQGLVHPERPVEPEAAAWRI